MITYKSDATMSVHITVLLERKFIGTIEAVEGGFAYFAQGKRKYKGETFKTVREVKDSIEEP